MVITVVVVVIVIVSVPIVPPPRAERRNYRSAAGSKGRAEVERGEEQTQAVHREQQDASLDGRAKDLACFEK